MPRMYRGATGYARFTRDAYVVAMRNALIKAGVRAYAAQSNSSFQRYAKNLRAQRRAAVIEGLKAQGEALFLQRAIQYLRLGPARRKKGIYDFLLSDVEEATNKLPYWKKAREDLKEGWGKVQKGGVGGYGVPPSFRLILGHGQLRETLDRISSLSTNRDTPSWVIVRSLAQLSREVEPILMEILEEATAGLSEGAFPDEYKEHVRENMLRMVKSTAPPQSTSNGVLSIFYDFNTLGDYGALTTAYHYKAMLAGADVTTERSFGPLAGRLFEEPVYGKVRLPYRAGQDLKNPIGRRYTFWKAVYRGDPYFISGSRYSSKFKTRDAYWTRRITIVNPGQETQQTKVRFTGSSISPRTTAIPPNAWKDTLQARIAQLRSTHSSPEWLLLEFGQPKWSPIIPKPPTSLPSGWTGSHGGIRPRGITGRFMKRVSMRWDTLVKENMEEYFRILDHKFENTSIGSSVVRLSPRQTYQSRFANATPSVPIPGIMNTTSQLFYKSISSRMGAITGAQKWWTSENIMASTPGGPLPDIEIPEWYQSAISSRWRPIKP